MDCKEFIELAPAFALRVLDEDERAACDEHLATITEHPACLAALAQARAIASKLPLALPGRAPHPRVWRAIESAITQRRTVGRSRAQILRELSGWMVAVGVLGFYLYRGPVADTPRADAAPASPPAQRRAVAMLMAAGTRQYVFHARQPGAARGSLIVNPTEHSAVVLVDRLVPDPGLGLRLWAVRNHAAPTPIGRLAATADGMAAAELDNSLFEPGLPDELLLSVDPGDAVAPRSVVMSAELN
jgi:hypothetical protein